MNATCRIAILASVTALGMTSPASRAEQTVNATLLSNAIQLETHSVKAGRVTLDVRNAADNNMEHGSSCSRPISRMTHSLSAKAGAGAQVEKIGEVEDIAPGKRKRASFTLVPGRYALICNKPGHYAAGMHTVLVVTP